MRNKSAFPVLFGVGALAYFLSQKNKGDTKLINPHSEHIEAVSKISVYDNVTGFYYEPLCLWVGGKIISLSYWVWIKDEDIGDGMELLGNAPSIEVVITHSCSSRHTIKLADGRTWELPTITTWEQVAEGVVNFRL